jgi:hypothetical protein
MIDYFFKWNSENAAMIDAIRLANYLGTESSSPPPMGQQPAPLLPILSLPLPPADTAGVKYAAAAFQGAGRMQAWTQPWFDWGTFRVLPNVKAWRPSLDSGSPAEHTYLAGWFAILAMEEAIPAILNDNNLAFALNRNWDPGASPKNLIVKNNIGAIITDVAVSPVFAGSNYPIGGFS